MPNWIDVLGEINELSQNNPLVVVRKKYLAKLSEHTGRNVISYYSGFLQKVNPEAQHLVSLTDDDKNGWMSAINGLDTSKGLDILLHTPGGDIAALESIGYYLRQKFGTDIRAIIPMMSMSCGTMLACCAKEIIMGKQSNIGPFDPQMYGLSVHGILEEFERAQTEITSNPAALQWWQFSLQKLNPTMLGECEKAIKWATDIVTDWLITGMFEGLTDKEDRAKEVCKQLNDHKLTYTHARHIHSDKAKDIGLIVNDLESDQVLQDLVLTIHHSYMHTFGNSNAAKIIENHNGSLMTWNISS
ncbi:SDH family Clp fold serine proteinase [Proteus mirabilis]|uniref:SDH family Clp fold serine proteinase n=1 Tax=Proteus mirabilis TaxID=584 RepID=UPI0023627221|nr:S49 family peptidase [Proteus mirabilis]MDC9735126.1 S49 family peptidase [Proteus mirabilis]MDC9773852.1 S49 family peptidase [Proteus mirabilis]MDC9781240.1 S49 family peptidase [Proteus mirabilis]MDF7465033.1 S49 family peptidase [Proteus mirabilis]MDL2096272.1 S49 family peptidase [Proteus mirabilis]